MAMNLVTLREIDVEREKLVEQSKIRNSNTHQQRDE